MPYGSVRSLSSAFSAEDFEGVTVVCCKEYTEADSYIRKEVEDEFNDTGSAGLLADSPARLGCSIIECGVDTVAAQYSSVVCRWPVRVGRPFKATLGESLELLRRVKR